MKIPTALQDIRRACDRAIAAGINRDIIEEMWECAVQSHMFSTDVRLEALNDNNTS